MNGTIIATVNVYSLTGQNVWQARSGDRVQISNGLLTRLERNGAVKLSGTYSVNLNYVKMDVVAPPVDPPVRLQNMRLTDLDTNESWDFVRKPNA